ncbi:MAG: hypothetical protein IKY59_07345 [Oscillospiraceae bacterium]|nr:hypothetical protein [Oscillospiraceae bacterium]
MMTERHFGIDVSTWQTGIDYTRAVREGGVEFAYLRAGFGKNVATQKDNRFEEHYNGFIRAGIPLGAYQYSYAKSPADAVYEAKAMLEWVEGKNFDLPLFLDMEESTVAELGKDTCTMIACAWMDIITNAGYECGIYSNPNWFTNYLDPDRIAEKGYIWCASWATEKPEYPNMLMWQYGGEINKLGDRAVAGVGEVVDQNFFYGPLTYEVQTEWKYVRCTKKTVTLDRDGKREFGRWIDKGDLCTIRLVDSPLIEVIYPTATGLRTAYLKDIENFRSE